MTRMSDELPTSSKSHEVAEPAWEIRTETWLRDRRATSWYVLRRRYDLSPPRDGRHDVDVKKREWPREAYGLKSRQLLPGSYALGGVLHRESS